MARVPYPKKHESFDSWDERCKEVEYREQQERQDHYNSSPDGEGLTDKQKAKLKKAEAKLPDGWVYWITNDNHVLGLRDTEQDKALATKEGGYIRAQVYTNGAEAAWLALLLNRACAAVWGKQPSWYEAFTEEEWKEAYARLKKKEK